MKQFWSDLGGKLGVGLIGAGFLLVFMGWNGAASVDRVPSQFPYLISGGVAGLCFVVVGVGVLVVQNQRADRAALQATMQELIRVMRDDDEVVDTGFELPTPRPTPAKYALDGAGEPAAATSTQTVTQTVTRGRRKPLKADGA